MSAKRIIFTIFCYFNLAYGKPQNKSLWDSLWKGTIPGELLRSLDAITSTHLEQPLQAHGGSESNMRFKRADISSVETFEENNPYDYNKAYEEFVKQYFEKSVNDARSASDSTEDDAGEQHDAETHSGEVLASTEDDEPINEASRATKKTEKCKNIVRGKQNCLLCKDTKNGATSESCSYNMESKPQSYEFKKQKNYRMYRAEPKNVDYEV